MRLLQRKIITFIGSVCCCGLMTADTFKRYTPVEVEVDRQISYVWGLCEREGIKDYDQNGIVNCCDYATAFCRKWNRCYGRRVRLVQQKKKLDHMYVQIQMDWGWWSIDPRWTVYGTHDMVRVWGNKYDPKADDTDAFWVHYFTRYIYE